jgi:hypothetical protein
MFKRTANSQQMLTRTANHSTKGSAKGYVDGVGINPALVLSTSEQREARRRALNAQIEQLCTELAQQKQASNVLLHRRDIAGHHDSVARANALRASIRNLRAEVTALNPGSRRIPSSLIERAFVDICKETMTKAHFDLILRQAMERARTNSIKEPE